MRSNFHENFERGSEISTPRSSDRNFGLIVGGVLALGSVWPLLHAGAPRWPLLAIGAALVLAALVRPAVLAPLNFVWFRIGMVLQKYINPVVMAAMFIIAIVPTAIIMRLLRVDPMRRGFDPSASSYWIARESGELASKTMRNQF
jgi:hypothetical protein